MPLDIPKELPQLLDEVKKHKSSLNKKHIKLPATKDKIQALDLCIKALSQRHEGDIFDSTAFNESIALLPEYGKCHINPSQTDDIVRRVKAMLQRPTTPVAIKQAEPISRPTTPVAFKKAKLKDQERSDVKPNGQGIQYLCKFGHSDYVISKLNGKYRDGTSKQEKIWCRHIAQYIMQKTLLSKSGKYNLKDRIEKSDSQGRKIYSPMKDALENEVYFRDNHEDTLGLAFKYDNNLAIGVDSIGNYFKQIASQLKPGDKPVAIRFHSENHAMVFQIQKKGDGSVKIKFYDPNQTNCYTNILFNDQGTVSGFNLNELLVNNYKKYFPEFSTCMMSWNGDKKCAEDCLVNENSAEKLRFYLFFDVSDKVKSYIDTVAKNKAGLGLTKNDVKELLSARRSDGTSGLFMALSKNHPDTVASYIDAVAKNKGSLGLSKDDVKELLSAKYKTMPGLFNALKKGNSSVVVSYIEAIARNVASIGLNKGEVTELLSAMGGSTAGLRIAMDKENSDAINKYIISVADNKSNLGLDTADIKTILLAKDINAKSGLEAALTDNKKDAVKAFMESVLENKEKLGLSDNDIKELLTNNARGVLYKNIKYGKTESVYEYLNVLKKISPDLLNSIIKQKSFPSGRNLLHRAVKSANESSRDSSSDVNLIKLLVENGAVTNKKDNYGKTPAAYDTRGLLSKSTPRDVGSAAFGKGLAIDNELVKPRRPAPSTPRSPSPQMM